MSRDLRLDAPLSIPAPFARLEGLSAEQIRHLRAHEKANKNRQSLIDRFDSKLRAL